MPRKRRRRPAAREEPNCSLKVHPISEVLSQKRATWVWARLEVMYYSTIQLRTRPARYILLMVRVPEVKIYFNVCGYSSCQMIGPIF